MTVRKKTINNTMGLKIKQISIITAPGVKTYEVGQKIAGGIIAEIRLNELCFTGDPFSHYCGYDENSKLLFNVDPMCPHECEYF